MTRKTAQLYLIVAAAIWGISSPVAKFALDYLPAPLLLTYRFFLICLLLLPIAAIKKLKLPKLDINQVVILIILGLLGTVGQIGLIYFGFTYTTSVDGTLIIATSPIIVVLASVIFLKERIMYRERIGILLATLGSFVVILSPLIRTGHIFSGSFKGNFFILLANFCWAGYVLISKYFLRRKFDPLFLTISMFIVGFTGMAFISLANYDLYSIFNFFTRVPLSGHLAILYLAAGAGIAGYLLYQKALSQIDSSEAELFNYLSPAFATPLAAIWLGEPITISFIISCILIGLGVFIAETNPKVSRSKKR